MRKYTNYIVGFLTLLLVIYMLLLDTLAKPLFEDQASEMYGAEVTVDSLEISPFVGKITLHQLRVADRSDPMRNLVETTRSYIDIDMLKFAENVIDVEQLDIEGLVVFVPRNTAATILRPLVKADSDLGQIGIPSFDIPDVDQLIGQQRDKLNAEVDALKTAMSEGEEKWRNNIKSLPSEEDIQAYKARIKKLNKGGGLAGALASANDARQVYAEIQQDLKRTQSMRKEFRGDITTMRETFATAADLPTKHTNELVASLGLDSSQIAQIGSQLLRGDLGGILQQALAPIAYSNAGKIDPEETMPIHISRATVSGPLLPSGAGLSATGELTNFSWPLEIASDIAELSLSGSSLDGGTLQLDASLDHRGVASDSVKIMLDRLPLRKMQLSGGEGMSIFLEQSLASVNGELKIDGESLIGLIDQHFTATVFDIVVDDNADDATKLIAQVLRNSNDFVMSLGLGGTVQSPELDFSANLDKLISTTIENAISQRVSQLTMDLQNQISNEIGPQIAAAREQFDSLEALEKQLQKNLNQMSKLSP